MRRSVFASGLMVAGLAVACAQRVTDPATEDPSRFGASEGACDSEGNAIVAVSSEGDFYRYTPSTRTFERLSHAGCRPRGGPDRVFGAAVDRHGDAWITYWEGSLTFLTPADGGPREEAGTLPRGTGLPDRVATKAQLYPVHVADGTCGDPILYDPDDFPVRAMAASNTPGLLFGLRLEHSATRLDVGLVTLDTTNGHVAASTELGPMRPYADPIDGAITQGSDGKLVGFFNALAEAVGVRPYFVSIDPSTGLMASARGTFPHVETRNLSTNAPDFPSAVAVWGGERWLFTGDPATEHGVFSASGSMLTRVPSDGTDSENMNRELDFLVVGAGVVACGVGPSPR
jgi:hypothetical protein